jgi:Na+-translocating ferredoxin:NAD+ oxidoreductase subunit B
MYSGKRIFRIKNMGEAKKIKRRDFIGTGIRLGIGAGLGTIAVALTTRSVSGKTIWQLDPSKCVQCGNCAIACVKQTSAVKCIHVTDMCGYCDLCSGYLRAGTKELNTGAENRLCPTNAIARKYVEEPYFEYKISEELCNGCGKCVKNCGAFGNGSLQLQVQQELCLNCNQCSIARQCPSQAFSRVDLETPYLLKGFTKK